MTFPFTSSSSSHFALTTDEQSAVIHFLQKLINTPSPSTQEKAVAAVIVEELKSVGVEHVEVDSIGNVIARIGTDENEPTLLFNAHMDTVEAIGETWTYDPFQGQIVGDRLYGLGASDMKGSIAALVYGIKKLLDAGARLNGNVVAVFVVQQEPCEGCSLKLLLQEQEIKPDWVVLGEPTHMGLNYGHRGRVLFKVTTQGKSSHASKPELGRNAVMAAARLIFGIDLLSADLPTDPFLGPGTVTVTHIESKGPGKNTIPNSSTFYVDRRLTLGETPIRAQAQIESIIQREGLLAEVDIMDYQAESYTGYTICSREAYSPWMMDRSHPLINQVSRAVESILGSTPVLAYWSFSTAGAYTMAEGNIPTVGFGPGNPEVAHTPDEYIQTGNVIKAAQVYAAIASRLLK